MLKVQIKCNGAVSNSMTSDKDSRKHVTTASSMQCRRWRCKPA